MTCLSGSLYGKRGYFRGNCVFVSLFLMVKLRTLGLRLRWVIRNGKQRPNLYVLKDGMEYHFRIKRPILGYAWFWGFVEVVER